MDPIPVPHIEDLSVKGQTFTGSIENGKMAGIFEIKRENYAGKNAASFPFDEANYTDLEVYLNASSSIESDESVLIELSRRITSGSKDVWEASHRLAKWVADTIDGAILSGTALQTFNRKKGDCGSQSFLMAALCRASGIPARVAYGPMYTREYDGSFGSHGWNEIFMGKAVWISIYVTLDETDYIDAGHIRLGIIDGFHTVLNYNNIEILDFEIGKLR